MPSDALRETQIERRQQRAREEITKVVNQGNHPLFSLFEVTSVFGHTLLADVQALIELAQQRVVASGL